MKDVGGIALAKHVYRSATALIGLLFVVDVPSASAQGTPDPFLSVPAPAPRQAAPSGGATAPGGSAAPESARQPAAPNSGFPVAVGQVFRDCPDCPEMVVIPSGRFTMGSPQSERGRSAHEGPQREVVVREPLAVGKFEVTFGEWDACVSAGGCSHRPSDSGWGRGRQPVMNVSWEDAQQYVRWLSSRTGRTYRLLTEAEWEYAARGGTRTPYSFGGSISPRQANFGNNVGRAQSVGSYPANRFGLHDMHGNVWEWVEDCYRASYSGAPADASVHVTTGASGCLRVVRGGSWFSDPEDLRSADRIVQPPGDRGLFVGFNGFRVARTPGS